VISRRDPPLLLFPTIGLNRDKTFLEGVVYHAKEAQPGLLYSPDTRTGGKTQYTDAPPTVQFKHYG
jgi:hypothetical protein